MRGLKAGYHRSPTVEELRLLYDQEKKVVVIELANDVTKESLIRAINQVADLHRFLMKIAKMAIDKELRKLIKSTQKELRGWSVIFVGWVEGFEIKKVAIIEARLGDYLKNNESL